MQIFILKFEKFHSITYLSANIDGIKLNENFKFVNDAAHSSAFNRKKLVDYLHFISWLTRIRSITDFFKFRIDLCILWNAFSRNSMQINKLTKRLFNFINFII